MDVKTEGLYLNIHVDDHVKVFQVGNNIQIVIHGDFGQGIVIEMAKDKYEEEMAPTWDVSDVPDVSEFVNKIVGHLLYRRPYTEEVAASLTAEYSSALLSNGSLLKLKDEVPAKAVADYVQTATKSLELPATGKSEALVKESCIAALLSNTKLYEMITED